MAETHTVKKGETLSGIAEKLLGDASRWKELGYTGDPTKMQIGTVLNVPGVVPTLESIQAEVLDVAATIPGVRADVKALAEVDTTLAPAIETNSGDIGALGAGLIGTDKQMQTLIETLAKQSEEAAKRADTAQKGILGAIASRTKAREAMPSVEDVTTTTLAKYGLTPESVQKVQGLIGQLAAYSQQAADLELQKQTAMGLSEQKGMPMTYIRGEQALVERQYNSKISAKAAQGAIVSQQIQMERGLWDEARTTTNMIVSAMTYDQQQELADLDWIYNTYQDLYTMATDEEKTIWNRAYTLAENELKKQQNEWNTKLALNQRAAEAGVSLGWDKTYMESHTVEELNAEYAERVSAAVRAAEVAATDVEGITDEQYKAGLLTDKTAGMSYEQAISSYGSVVGLDYIDRVYGEGKYLLQEFEIKEKEEEQAATAEWQAEYDKWIAKSDDELKKEKVHKFEFVNDDGDMEVRFTKASAWKGKMSETILFSYLK